MRSTLRSLLAICTVALFAVLIPASLPAQTLDAHYPLLTDLNDATNNYGPVMLAGSPPPSPPTNNSGVCHNGMYHYGSTPGQDIRTPDIWNLDANDFQLDVEFNLAALPTFRFPVIMGGNGWRWIGIYVDAVGTVGIKYNNSNYIWSATSVTPGVWYSAVLRHENGTLNLYIDGNLIHQATNLPALNTGPAGQKNFTTNDYSNGNALNGCIRHLRLWNDTCLTCGLFTRRVNGCGGLTITEGGNPSIGSSFTLDIGGPSAASSAFLFGVTPMSLPLCPQAPCVLGLGLVATIPGPNLTLPIPNTPMFVGAEAYFQGIAVGGTGGCFQVITVTDTIKVTVGQ